MTISYEWRGEFENAELNALHAEGFGHPPLAVDWSARVNRHSLGWVCARDTDHLAGFVNVAWDGGIHAFILETVTAPRLRRQGLGTGLIACAVEHSRAAGCHWLHVDFEEHLDSFYFQACGFEPTLGGLIRL